jgi:hypothetical protein
MSPIATTDIQFRHSGGSANSNPDLDLGGVESSNQLTDATDNNLFDDVTGAESAAGSVEHRGIYAHNNDGSRTLQDARIYISVLTTSSSTELDIGIAVEAVNTTMATIANETTVPGSVTFSRPTTYAGGLQLNAATGLAAGARRGVWVRRTVTAGATAAAGDSGTLKIEGDSVA